MQVRNLESTRRRARDTVQWLVGVTAIGMMPVVTYALGRIAWESANLVISSSQLMPGSGPTALSLGQVLSPTAAAAGALVAAHLTWTAAVLLATPRRSRLHTAVQSLTPASWRRLVAMVLTGVVSAGLALPAAAASHNGAADHPDAGWVSAPAQSPAQTADDQSRTVNEERPTGSVPDASRAAVASDIPDRLVVAPGDTLWDISAEYLGLEPDNHVAITAAWLDLYHHNRDIIGADPDVIIPGQELHLPAGWSA